MNRDEHRERLLKLRDQLASAIEGAPENMLPQLAGQYRATLDDLAKIEELTPKASVQDELRERRAKRRSKTA